MKTKSSCRNGLHIPHFLVELLLQERNSGYTHTQTHHRIYLEIKFSKLLRDRKTWFYRIEEEMKTVSSCLNEFNIRSFLVELL